MLPLFALLARPASAQTPESEIRQVLAQQADDWNRGDVRSFMRGYAPDATYVSDKVTRGSAEVLERYLKRYPTPESRGRLTFSDLEIRMLGPGYAAVVGRWQLERSATGGGNVGGIYSLVFRKTAAGWKIILDHTS